MCIAPEIVQISGVLLFQIIVCRVPRRAIHLRFIYNFVCTTMIYIHIIVGEGLCALPLVTAQSAGGRRDPPLQTIIHHLNQKKFNFFIKKHLTSEMFCVILI